MFHYVSTIMKVDYGKKGLSRRNPVAKFARQFNRANFMKDKKKSYKRENKVRKDYGDD